MHPLPQALCHPYVAQFHNEAEEVTPPQLPSPIPQALVARAFGYCCRSIRTSNIGQRLHPQHASSCVHQRPRIFGAIVACRPDVQRAPRRPLQVVYPTPPIKIALDDNTKFSVTEYRDRLYKEIVRKKKEIRRRLR
jgi:hypothetical protein